MAETATVQIAMPEMGESVTEGIVLEWHVAEGDTVSEGDTVVEVSTDKVDAEVPAPVDGVITKLVAAVDDEGSGEPRPADPAVGEDSSPSQASGDQPSPTSPAGGTTAADAGTAGNGAGN